MAKPAPKSKQTAQVGYHCHDGREISTLVHVIELLLEIERLHMALDATVTAALAAQDQKLADLAAKVDQFIAAHQGTSAADAAALVSAVQAQGAVVDGIAAKVTPTA